MGSILHCNKTVTRTRQTLVETSISGYDLVTRRRRDSSPLLTLTARALDTSTLWMSRGSGPKVPSDSPIGSAIRKLQ